MFSNDNATPSLISHDENVPNISLKYFGSNPHPQVEFVVNYPSVNFSPAFISFTT